MSAHEERTLRSATKKMASVSSPTTGDTTSAETNTWSKGTSDEQYSAGGNITVPHPANVMRSEGSAQPAATRYPAPTIEDDNESVKSSTVVGSVHEKADTVSSRMSILQAELDLQNAELEQAQKATAAARSRLEIARIEASQSSFTAPPAPVVHESRVLGWIERHRSDGEASKRALLPPPKKPNYQPPPLNTDSVPLRGESPFVNRDIELLSNRFVEAVQGNSRQTTQRNASELPPFDGNITEWIAFRAEFDDSASSFTDVANIGRIRKALRGDAKLAVRSIMYTVSNPYEIIEALERQFGDPEEIVLAEMQCVKRMPRLADDNSNITTFAAQVANVVSTIKSLRQEEFLYAPEMVNKIVDKMNLIVRYEWNKYRANNKAMPGLAAMAQFLNEISSASRKTYARSRPTRSNVNVVKEYGSHSHNHAPPRARGASRKQEYSRSSSTEQSDSDYEEFKPRTVAQVNRKPHVKKNVPSHAPRQPKQPIPAQVKSNQVKDRCVVCNGVHKTSLCADFVKLQIAQRWETAKNNKLCFRCLDASHRRPFKCEYVACGVNQCEAGHHRLLHGLNSTPAPARANVSSSVNHARKVTTFLKVVPVEVSGPLGVVSTYALLDDGSSLTMIERHIADQVAPKTRSEPLSFEGVGGNIVNDQESCRVQLSIRGACSRNFDKMTAYTIGQLNLAAQSVGRELVESCEHLQEIKNELCYDYATPTILVGQDHWNLLACTQIRSGAKDMPVASLTRLGWILHGKHEANRSTAFVVNHVKQTECEREILTLIKENFSIESLGIESKIPKADPDQRAIEILNATCVKNAKGTAYQAGLLWRTENESLPDNRNQALKRLHNLEHKLDKDENLKIEYSKQIKNLVEKGYAEVMESPPPVNSPRTWYLPHFPVFHAQKLKMRLVFDAASRAHGKCLNDALLTGPDLLQSLFGVLLRFREGKIAVTADIREMFLQIEVEESDRDSLRFLWRGEERQREPREYRMKKLIFGSACSPATALFVKNKNAHCNEKLYPEAANITIRNSYMDDFLIALDSSEAEARRVVNEVHKLNSLASFELTGFASNRPDVIKDVKASSHKESTPLGVKSESERTLGLIWNHARDTLGFNVNLRNTPPDVLNGTQLPTKRQVTSSVMSVYDPLGYASPITVIGKALIQDIWRTGIGWDEPIRAESIPTWKSFIENVKLLKNLEIERYVPACNRKGEIHTFCDASEKVYAAAVYFVSNEPGGGKSSRLVAAKAKVAPLKTISIPRLELQGCVLGARLTKTVIEQTDYEIVQRHFWSDSRTVLAWIKSDPRSFKSFVAHRLAEIEDTTAPTEWRWVPSALNTADDATKGVPTKFEKNHRWFQGPEFIRRDNDEWPVDKSAQASAPPTGEERPPRVVLATQIGDAYSYLPQIDRFSNFTRLIRSAATVLFAAEVFKAKMLNRKHETEMNRDHLRLAELLLVRRSQNITFGEDIRRLHRGEPTSRGSPLGKLTAKLDAKGTLLLDSRIDRGTAIPILHAKEKFTRLLIAYYHAKFNHGNHKTVMNELTQRYHIVGLRGTMRYICEKCQWCKTHKGKPLKLPYGDLPPERLMSQQPPFTATACDLFGPVTVTIGRRHEKRWGALFTCLTTRAVHLELVASLSAASLILALRRMMARRGTPTVLYSDNGTNFVGAEREIADALLAAEDQIKKFTEYKEITWKKIPPGNPAAGGAWERLVASIKTALRATLFEKHPKEEVLHTLLLEAEHMVNSRPLTPLTSTHEEALTPNHFLLGRSNAMSPFGSFHDTTMDEKSWHQAQRMADYFWNRWTTEYRPQLKLRLSHGRSTENIKPGDIVIIVDGTMPRATWPKGEIVQTHPGPDGVVRVVEVRTTAGLLRRPASRLIKISETEGVSTRGGDCRK